MHSDEMTLCPGWADSDKTTVPITIAEGAATAEVRWTSHGLSVVGNRRKINEDAVLDRPDLGMWVVADGMGGHLAGDVASRTIVETLDDLKTTGNLDDMVERVSSLLRQVNADLHRMGNERMGGQVVGSTVVVFLTDGREGVVLWAGDSRLYRYRRGGLEQLTRDHSLLDEMMRSGLLVDENAAELTNSNIITRAIGAEAGIELDILRFRIEDGDAFILCSDGLNKELSPSEIAARLFAGTCEDSAKALIDAALHKLGRDNISVVVIRTD